MRTQIAASAASALALGAGLATADAAEASYEHLSISVDRHILKGSRDQVSGRMRPAQKDRVVWIYARGPGTGGWKRVAKPTTNSKGRFRTSWRPRAVGQFEIRALLTGSDAPQQASSVTVYREAGASYYGPGLYGRRTACGQTLTSSTLGVAHKTLPCGTRVAFYYRGNHITVRVIDRGPYVAGREWDLTEATKNRLHFGSTGTLWSAPLG
jgi:rare lipoprotein A